MVRQAKHGKTPKVWFRQFWGGNKRSELLESLNTNKFDEQYDRAEPDRRNRFSFRLSRVSDAFRGWPSVTELCSFQFALGILENRQDALNDMSQEPLIARIQKYFNPALNLGELPDSLAGLKGNMARFDAAKCRARVLSSETFNIESVRRYLARPFDTRWCYYSETRPLWNEARQELTAQLWKGNLCLVSRRRAVSSHEGMCMFVTGTLGNQHAFLKDA